MVKKIMNYIVNDDVERGVIEANIDVGLWQDGQRHGWGKVTTGSGIVLLGEFQNDR